MSIRFADRPTPAEMDWAASWAARHFGPPGAALPFSFVCDGRWSSDLLGSWVRAPGAEERDGARSRRALTWTDPQTGLEVRCVLVTYGDYPTLEWTLYLRNAGSTDTPVLSDIRAIDAALAVRPADGGFTLHHFAGGFAEASAYQPFATAILPGEQRGFSAAGDGRRTGRCPSSTSRATARG